MNSEPAPSASAIAASTPAPAPAPHCLQTLPVRGVPHAIRHWNADARSPLVLMLHGWMDVGASFGFLADALPRDWRIAAPDLRGFGDTPMPAGADTSWFYDYLGDVDAICDALSPDAPVLLLGHSMGGNIASLYAGIRPERVKALLNVEGFGMPRAAPEAAVDRFRRFVDSLKQQATPRRFENLDALVRRLMRNDRRLDQARADEVARMWARPVDDGSGGWELKASPIHMRPHAVNYQLDEVLAVWSQIIAPTLWVYSSDAATEFPYTAEADYRARLERIRDLEEAHVQDSGHMMHHHRPEALARVLSEFVERRFP